MGVTILLVIGVAVLCSMPFLPLIQEMAYTSINATAPMMDNTPFIPIMGLWPLLAIGILFIAAAWALGRST